MDGHFSDDSAIRRIGRESVLMLGGPRALLMQAAHPLVAAGIVDHSRYGEEPWRRLARTMTALYTIVFGTQAEGDRMGEITRRAHRSVHGSRDGRAYSAADPDLMLWVHSTLVDTGLALYELYVRPLDPAEAEEFYEQMQAVAHIFGVPDDVHPPTLAAFRSYQRDLIENGTVRVGDDARAVAATVLSPPVPLPLRPALRLLAAQTAGLLPADLREQYGIRRPLPGTAGSMRRLIPLLPAQLRRTERLPLRVLTAFAGL
ncbi:MAG TPA: oxygenase MpaB family protein [Gaiellaceae bacterium]|nr:oxygenase MpaB family protein [Gaiellaceae bacterium]